MRVHDLAHDRQAQARALRLGREERTENALQVVGRNARPGVAHFDDDLRRLRLAVADRLVFARQQRRADVDVAFAAERFERVGEQVREQLAQLVRVGQQLRHVRLDDVSIDTAPRRILPSASVIESFITSSSATRSTCS